MVSQAPSHSFGSGRLQNSSLVTVLVLSLAGTGAAQESGSSRDAAAAGPAGGAATTAEVSSRAALLPADELVQGFQLELLDIAFDAVTEMPLNPHVRNRARGQDHVVATALQMGVPSRALAYLEQIPNWRKGAAYADLAFYCAEREHLDPVQQFLDEAFAIASLEDDWQGDRVRTKIARTHSLLGDSIRAMELSAGARDAEAGRAVVVEAQTAEVDDIDRHIDYLEEVNRRQSFDLAQHALQANSALFDRFYDDEELREKIETAINANWGRTPLLVRIDILIDMSSAPAKRGNTAHAGRLVDQAQALVDSSKWRLEDEIPVRSKLAIARHRAGEPARARAEADVILSIYEAGRDTQGSGYRARTLRPLGEALVEIGDREAGKRILVRALEEGTVNPNSRPRAVDLSATCCSMARLGVEPDAELLARVREILDGLGDPW